MFKNLKGPPFTVFGIVTFLKMNNFCLKIRFSQAKHSMSDFCFFFKDRCFLCDFFSNCFHRSRPQFLLETKRFASIRGCSRFSGLCDLPETFIEKIFEQFRFFPEFSVFFLMFSVEKDSFFCCFHYLGLNGFRYLCVTFRVFLAL